MREAKQPNRYGQARHRRPTMVVVHAMGEFVRGEDGIDRHAPDWLGHLRLSAHAFVTPSGTIIRAAEDERICWHARGFNTRSLGVEFLVPGVHDIVTLTKAISQPYLTEAQFEAGVRLVAEWRRKHDIRLRAVVQHSELDQRKPDPGDGFPWNEFVRRLGEWDL